MPGPSVSVWRFVDRPEAGATVLLDMHNPAAGWKVSREDFDISPPQLKRSIASNAMGDGGVVTASSYELRELKFTIELSAESEDWRAAQLKALEAELAKPSNLIMYQPRENSYPVFFRTIRSDDPDLDNQYIPGKVWRVPLAVLAEPFAIGVRHDIASNLVVQNDPASGANPTFFDISGIRGDAPSPAFARFGTNFGAGAVFLVAQRSGNNPAALTAFAQCESGTLGTDTAGNGTDASMSGAAVGNAVANPGFESGTTTGWTATAGTVLVSSATPHSGTRLGLFDASGASGARFATSSSFGVLAGASCTASAWVRQNATFTGGRVGIRYFDSGGATISTVNGTTVTLSATWQQATTTSTAPATAVTAAVIVEFTPDPGAAAASALFDDVSFSPGSNYVRCTFGTNTLISRVTVTVPTASSPEALRGRYRVLVKVRRSSGTSTFTLRYLVSGASGIAGPQVTYDAALPHTWLLDLGVLEFPSPGPTPATIGYSGLQAGYAAQTLEIQAKREVGSLVLDMDYVYLVPADERMCAIRQTAVTGTNVIDGPNDMTYGMPSASDPFGAAVTDRVVNNAGGLLPRIGGLPMLVPGQVNRWYILRTPHDVTATSTWWVSYWPRWRDVATS